MYRKVCVQCSKPYKSRRTSAKYCSPACSTAAYRKRRAAKIRAQGDVLTPDELRDVEVINGMTGNEGGLVPSILVASGSRNREQLLHWVRYAVHAAYDTGWHDRPLYEGFDHD
jgi:hypothetical protein